jgi:hypothetical protein
MFGEKQNYGLEKDEPHARKEILDYFSSEQKLRRMQALYATTYHGQAKKADELAQYWKSFHVA